MEAMDSLPHRPRNLPPGILALLLGILTACSEAPSDAPLAVEAPQPPLVRLAESGDLPAIDSLLAAGISPDPVDSCRWTPLMKAALNGHVATARRLLDAGADPNARDKGGYTSLMFAASRDHEDLVGLLLERGANPDAQESTKGWTALIWAAKEGRHASIRLLLAMGADPSRKDREGRTAADWARDRGDDDIPRLLSGGPPEKP